MTGQVGIGLAALVAVLLSGCPGSDEPSDGGPDSAVPDGGSTPFNIPWLDEGGPPVAEVNWTPCPEGWREVPGTDGAPTTCDPLPASGAADCPVGEAHFVGEAGCVPVGDACPTGPFADTLPTEGTVVFVQVGATGGDGTRERPYGSLDDFALGGLPTDAVVALSRGTHVARVRLSRGLTLFGACAAETRLTTPDDDDVPLVTFLESSGGLRNMTLLATGSAAVLVDGEGARARLEGVSIDHAVGIGVRIRNDGDVDAEGLVVQNTQTQAGLESRGISIASSGSLEATRLALVDNRTVGLYVTQSSAASVSDAIIRRTLPRESNQTSGRGINCEGSLELTRVLVEENHQVGIVLFTSSGVATLTDVVVRRTLGQQSDGSWGMGLTLIEGANVTAERLLLADNRGIGANLIGAGSSATLTDVVITGTLGEANDDTFGRAVDASGGARVELVRAFVADNRDVALFATGEGTALTATDLILRRTEPRGSDDQFGRALAAQRGASLMVERASLEDQYDIGILLHEDASGTLTDVAVRRTRAQRSDGRFGRALSVQEGSTCTLTRALFEDQQSLGMGFLRSTGTLSDVVVRDTKVQTCSPDPCEDGPAGHGLGIYRSTLDLAAFEVESSDVCGVMLANDAQADLTAGEVRGQPIGVCLQIDGYDTSRLTNRVRFLDNGVNLDATTLPVPGPAVALTGP